MGNQKLKWTAEEEETLRAGVQKHGTGKWKNILLDPEFRDGLANRSNVDLKDKWRNMGAYSGQGCGASSVTPKGKATVTNAVTLKVESSSSVCVAKDIANDKHPHSPPNVENALNREMVLDALSSTKDPDGSDFASIMGFIEKKYGVPQSSRRLLSAKLRRLVLQGKLEKVQKRYKIKQAETSTITPTPKQKDVGPRPLQESTPIITVETVEDAAETAAQAIAEAEHKSFLVAQAVKESERISNIADDADALLMYLQEMFEQYEGHNTSS